MKTSRETISFEDAMKELENIVEGMESEQLALSHIISRYERASYLLKCCHSELSQVRKRIEQITTHDQAVEKTARHASKESKEDNDITLF